MVGSLVWLSHTPWALINSIIYALTCSQKQNVFCKMYCFNMLLNILGYDMDGVDGDYWDEH